MGKLPCGHGTGTDVADFALADEQVEGGKCLVDGCMRIVAMDLVEVDGLHAQSPQSRLAALLDMLPR